MTGEPSELSTMPSHVGTMPMVGSMPLLTYSVIADGNYLHSIGKPTVTKVKI